MAINTFPSIFLTFLLCTSLLQSLLFLSEKAYAYGGDTTETRHFHRHVIGISSLLPSTGCSTPTATKGLNNRPLLKIVHKHGPCLKARLDRDGETKTKTSNQILKQILLQDQIRVESLQYILSNDSKEVQAQNLASTLPANSGIALGTNNYIVRVGFGTPKKDLSLIFDTGSDITWIQCQPCASCYQQIDPIFDPSKSETFSNITCNTVECYQLKSPTHVCPSSSSPCNYGLQFGDGLYSVGFFGRETLTITPSDVFPNFVFGCGQNNRVNFGSTAGLLGLSRNKLSLVSQTIKKYGGIFSYCLPSKSSTGFLTFGYKGSHSSSIKFTPFLMDPRGPSFYFLYMMAISVGGQKLPISTSVFASSGLIIDSGTTITRLPPSAYSVLRSAFQKSMSSYPLTQPFSTLDTCYDLTGYNNVKIPTITLYFWGNVKVDIDPFGIVVAGSASQVCLAFAGNDNAEDVAILGNQQQQKLEVIYDVGRGKLGFSPRSCN